MSQVSQDFEPKRTAADRRVARMHVRRKRVLLALLAVKGGVMSSGAIVKAVCSAREMTSAARLTADVLDPLREAGLLEVGRAERWIRDTRWSLTRAGRKDAERHARKVDLEAARIAALQPPSVAGPRAHLYLDQPLPPGEHQVIRPGAYRYRELPSRMGDWLHYRDGRVVHVSERDAAQAVVEVRVWE